MRDQAAERKRERQAVSGGLEHLILSGPVLLAMPVAAAAGAITFLSPCCLPLVPGYLAYLTGMSGATADGPSAEQAAEPARSLSPAVAAAGAPAGGGVPAPRHPAPPASPAATPAPPPIPGPRP